jgi:Fic family protein
MGTVTTGSAWQPRYALTSAMATDLMAIEAARVAVAATPLTLAAEADLRHRARVRSTHYSTRIEGNRLTLDEARRVVEDATAALPGRSRDVREARDYWGALLAVEAWAAEGRPLTEELTQRLHARVEHGSRARPTPYRDGQNAIRDSVSGALVYLPPEAPDVPLLMGGLLRWAAGTLDEGLPVPIVAGQVHYQFVTIHPFFDGNGRTARLLATFLLHRGGYGLGGFFSLEEHHARDLQGYYAALVTHPHHNYYSGRADVELSDWLAYFLHSVAVVFTAAQDEALRAADTGAALSTPAALRRLDARARRVLTLFADRDEIRATDVAAELGLSDRTARELLTGWVSDDWLTVANSSRRGRRYALSAGYRQFIGGLSADGGQ